MSIDLHVSLPASRLVSSDQWQRALDALRFPFRLDTINWATQGGWLPVHHDDSVTGFELHLDDIEEFRDLWTDRIPAAHDLVVSFYFGGHTLECQSAYCAAAALVQATGGVLLDPQQDESFDSNAAISQAREVLLMK